jgi:hypothetical protein
MVATAKWTWLSFEDVSSLLATFISLFKFVVDVDSFGWVDTQTVPSSKHILNAFQTDG